MTILAAIFLMWHFVIMDELLQPTPSGGRAPLTRVGAHVFFDGLMYMWFVMAWFVSFAHHHVYRKEALLKAESAKARVERKHAEEQRERAEAERQRAESERKTADAERQRAEEARQKANAEWERAEAESQRANHFVESVSHDLKQPMSGMTHYLAILRRKVREMPELLALVKNVHQQNYELGKLIQACFDLSRLNAGIWDLNIEEVTLPTLIERTIMDGRALAADKGVMLECAVVPQYIVRTDRDALARIVANLVGNALKYTPSMTSHGQGRVTIECVLVQNNKFINIAVVDNGRGIPENKLEDIFKAYVQLDNPERDRTKGFGLGLSIVRGLARLLGHELKVESIEGQGSRFSVIVPIASRIPRDMLCPHEMEEFEPNLEGMVVAVVEDDTAVREALVTHLRELGCSLIDGGSAEQVVGKSREGGPTRPHCIISDYRLPYGKTGIEAIAAIRAETSPSVPAVIVTAETASEKLQSIAEQGIEIIPKTSDTNQLLKLLSKHKPTDIADNEPAAIMS